MARRSGKSLLNNYLYAENLDQNLVQYLCNQLAEGLSNDMHQIEGGTAMLMEAFIKQRKIPNWKSGSIHLGEKIMFNITVDEIEYEATDHNNLQMQSVTVKGYHTNSGQSIEVHGMLLSLLPSYTQFAILNLWPK